MRVARTAGPESVPKLRDCATGIPGKGREVLEETDLAGNFEQDYVYALGKLLGRQDAPATA